MINQFKGPYSWLSNFEPVIIYTRGYKYPTVEHAYVASKSKDPDFWAKISRMDAKYAGLAKKEGRTVELRENWEKYKIQYMKEFLNQKFHYFKFKNRLLITGNEEIVEGNYWHDNFWGDCFCEKCKNIEGKNNLGKLIMVIRKELV